MGLIILNERAKSYLTAHKSKQIKAIAEDKERSAFFNKILATRNIKNSSPKEILSTIVEAVDAAYRIKKDEMAFELATYYKSNVDKQGMPNYSSLLNVERLNR